ncbi:MAG: NUDIX domain-containing protein [Pseudomonadales bacterium]|nr:NUDIX domain-containing protein [Halieaceae bacterium]MCP5164356.1 NUDIX domain-containing protein [Pseudomonadales bacterium]MCP5189806.1 NUDIX domain-containing protein [Pseudomonadales bacterium]
MSDIPEPRPASTVVLLRDGADGLETLLLKRNKALMFAGGLWVFPGGALEEGDLAAAGGDELLASRIAAAREAEEESGLHPRQEDMVLVSHWTTPVVESRRFSTWIYAAPVAVEKDVVIDGGEIHDHLWIGLGEALARHRRGELAMLPPTYVTLCTLASYDCLAELVAEERSSGVPEVLPLFASDEGKVTLMFRGDAGYDSGDPAAAGARHRAVLHDGSWVYTHSGVDPSCPSLVRS